MNNNDLLWLLNYTTDDLDLIKRGLRNENPDATADDQEINYAIQIMEKRIQALKNRR